MKHIVLAALFCIAGCGAGQPVKGFAPCSDRDQGDWHFELHGNSAILVGEDEEEHIFSADGAPFTLQDIHNIVEADFCGHMAGDGDGSVDAE
jgi:hypothetical protein